MPITPKIFPDPEDRPQRFWSLLSQLLGRNGRDGQEHILSQQEQSRLDIENLNREVIRIATEIEGIRKRINQLQQEIQDLENRFPDFGGRRLGRRIGYVLLCLTCFPFSFALDLVVMGPVAEAIAVWTGFSFDMPVRIAGSLAMTAILYIIGAKFGIARQDRQQTSFWVILTLLTTAFFGSVAYFMAKEAGYPLSIAILGIVGPLFAFGSGVIIPDAMDYLYFFSKLSHLRRKVQNLNDRLEQLGQQFIDVWMRLCQAIDRHQRNFNERIDPYVTPLVSQAVQIFSNGRYELEIQAPARGDGQAKEPPEDPQDPPSGIRQAVREQSDDGSIVVNVGEQPDDGSIEDYLRRQLEQAIHASNSELVVPQTFENGGRQR